MMQKIGYVPDARTRRYVAPVRELSGNTAVSGLEQLFAGEIQSYVHPGQPLCRIAPGGEIVLDFGRELAGGVRIVTAPNDGKVSTIRITFGESVSEALAVPDQDHAIHRTDLALPPTGMTEYGNTGFRFVRIEVPKDASRPLELIGVCAVALFRNLDYVGRFECSDERLNRVWATGAYTVHLCMQDFIYDGVKRDRMVWAGDLYPEIQTILAVFDDTAAVEDTLDFAIAHTPEDDWINGISSYSAWWILCLHLWHRHRNRKAFLEKHRERIRRILLQLEACISPEGQEWLTGMRFLDWANYADPAATHAGLQGLLAWTMQCGAQLAQWLDDAALSARCLAAWQRLRQYPLPPGNSKSAGAMQVLGGLARPDELNRTLFAPEPCRTLSPFFGGFVLQSRALAGDLVGALEVIRRYWGGMLDLGATTFWESFDLDWARHAAGIDVWPRDGATDIHRDFGEFCYQGFRHSLCHGWAASPTAFLTEHILGITPASPGFRDVKLRPATGLPAEFHGSVPTPEGVIQVESSHGRTLCRLPDGIRLLQPVESVEVVTI